jgi:hypothetical protein
MKIAIGPARDAFPSWHWCGGDLIPELARHHDIRVFRRYSDLTRDNFDAVLAVKIPPSTLSPVKVKRLVYIPVDFFETMGQVRNHLSFLKSCHRIATHCSRLDSYLGPHCDHLAHVDHYGKYVLPEMAPYRTDGLVLWTGQGKYVKNLLQWHALHPPRCFDLRILTNDSRLLWPQPDALRVRVESWSEARHMSLLGAARAGLDIKGSSFEQMTKPPTKAQQSVASGVPFAVNRESYSWEWFHSRGFDLADPDDEQRWFSHRYWEETREFGLHLREELSKERVVASYLAQFERKNRN